MPLPPTPPQTPPATVTVTSQIWIDANASSDVSASAVVQSLTAAMSQHVPDVILNVQVEQKVRADVLRPATVTIDALDDAMYVAYCESREGTVCTLERITAARRRLQAALTVEAFNVTRELAANERLLAAPAVNSTTIASLLGNVDVQTLSLSSTLLGNVVRVSAQSSAAAESALVGTAIDTPSQLATDLGIDSRFIYMQEQPRATFPPSPPPPPLLPSSPTLSSPAPPANVAATEPGGSALRGATAGFTTATYDLIYQSALLIIGFIFTFCLVKLIDSQSDLPITATQYLPIFVGVGVFTSTAMFSVSVFNQWSDLEGRGVDMPLRISALGSAGLLLLSFLLSSLLTLNALGQSARLLDRSSFQSHQLMHSCVLLLTPITFESVQLLPWRDANKGRMSAVGVRLRFVLPPLLTELPLAAVFAFYTLVCLTEDAMAEERTIHLVTALLPAALVLASLCTRVLGRCCYEPQGTSVGRLRVAVGNAVDSLSHAGIELEDKRADGPVNDRPAAMGGLGTSARDRALQANEARRAERAGTPRRVTLVKTSSFGRLQARRNIKVKSTSSTYTMAPGFEMLQSPAGSTPVSPANSFPRKQSSRTSNGSPKSPKSPKGTPKGTPKSTPKTSPKGSPTASPKNSAANKEAMPFPSAALPESLVDSALAAAMQASDASLETAKRVAQPKAPAPIPESGTPARPLATPPRPMATPPKLSPPPKPDSTGALISPGAAEFAERRKLFDAAPAAASESKGNLKLTSRTLFD